MRKLSYLLCATFVVVLFASCGITKIIPVDANQVTLANGDFEYVGKYEVDSKAELYILGIGGGTNENNILKDLEEKANLNNGEALVNITLRSFIRLIPFNWLPIVAIKKYYAEGDKIRFKEPNNIANDVNTTEVPIEIHHSVPSVTENKHQDSRFEDVTFFNLLCRNADNNRDGILSNEELSSVTKLDLSFSTIRSFKGIEYLINLEDLKIRGNHERVLDLSNNKKLNSLYNYIVEPRKKSIILPQKRISTNIPDKCFVK